MTSTPLETSNQTNLSSSNSNFQIPNARDASQIKNKRSIPKNETEQIQTPIIFKTNNQTLTDKFKLGQPNKQIGSNDLQQRQSNSGNQLQKPDKRRSKFSKLTNSKWSNKFQMNWTKSSNTKIDLQISNTKFKFQWSTYIIRITTQISNSNSNDPLIDKYYGPTSNLLSKYQTNSS